MAFNGRYGPYVERGSDRRNLEREEDVFAVTPEQAMALFAQPRMRRQQERRRVEPLRELGNDPVSGKLITLREGRFGPYVTDGETNASLRTGDDPDSLAPERAHELLQLRRERGPAAPKGRRKGQKVAAAPKKKAAKKAPVAKAAKKPAVKKAAKKKKAARKPSAKKDAAVSKNGNGHATAADKKKRSRSDAPQTTAP
jgi:DNA topoisomerase-1